MIVLALLAAAQTSQLTDRGQQPRLEQQAVATVRILAGARINGKEAPAEALVRTTDIDDQKGGKFAVRLFEFQ